MNESTSLLSRTKKVAKIRYCIAISAGIFIVIILFQIHKNISVNSNHKWKITTEQININGVSKVYIACLNDNCNYAAKVTDIEINMKISKLAGEFGIGPRIYDYYWNNGKFHIIMDYINGTALHNTLLTTNVCRSLYSKIDLMHANRIYHNDLHSGNIIVTSNSDVFIIDYTMASWLSTDPNKLKLQLLHDNREVIYCIYKVANSNE